MNCTAEQLVDQFLVMQCQDGEASALRTLVDRWQGRLWRHAYRLTRDHEGAWESMQEAWLGIIRGLSRLGDPACFRPWAYRIVTRKAADWIRRHQRSRNRNRTLDADPPAPAEGSDISSEVRAILASLPVAQRAVLSLRYLEELSIAEIAVILDIPTGTVKSRLHHARDRLKRLLETRRESG